MEGGREEVGVPGAASWKAKLQLENLGPLPGSGGMESAHSEAVGADELLNCTANEGFLLGAQFLHPFKPSVLLFGKPKERVIRQRAMYRQVKSILVQRRGVKSQDFQGLGFL